MDYSLDQLMDGGMDSLPLDGPAADAITKLIVEGRDCKHSHGGEGKLARFIG